MLIIIMFVVLQSYFCSEAHFPQRFYDENQPMADRPPHDFHVRKTPRRMGLRVIIITMSL